MALTEATATFAAELADFFRRRRNMDFQQAKVKILRKAKRHLPSVHNSVTLRMGAC